MDIKIANAEPAVGFNCAYCGKYNFEHDFLERDDDYAGSAIEADIISCEKCGEDNKVVRYL